MKNLMKNLIIENKLEDLLDQKTDHVLISNNSAYAELRIEILDSGEPSIYISEIWSDVKNKGYATKLLVKLKKISDKYDIPLTLRASIDNNIQSSKGLNQKQLVKWYKKYGFKKAEEHNRFPSDSSAPFMIYNYD